MTTTLPAPSDPLQMRYQVRLSHDAIRGEIARLEREEFQRGANPERTNRLNSLYRKIMPGACRCRMVDCSACDPGAAAAASGEESNDERL